MGYNQPPDTPNIQGKINGKIGIDYTYTFTASDPDSDQIFYYVEWGDGTKSGWLGPYYSSEPLTLSHSWTEKDIYTIKCKAKDVYEVQSNWGYLEVSMPHNTLLSFPILNWLIQQFPIFQRLLLR